MKRFLLIAALALMAAAAAAPSYGQTSVPDTPDIGVMIPSAPAAQLDVVYCTVMADYHITPCSSINQDILSPAGTWLNTWNPVVRIPMLKPEDAPKLPPLYGVRLWRSPVLNESVSDTPLTSLKRMSPYCVIRQRRPSFTGNRQVSDSPVLNINSMTLI